MLVLRKRKIHLLPTRERSRRLLFRKDIQDKAKVIRTKARMGHLVRQGRLCVISVDSLDTFDVIAHGGKNPKVMGHLSPNRQWDELGLPIRQDRWYASTACSPGIGGGIALRGRDPRIWGQCSPSQLWDRSGYISFLHTLVWIRGTSFSRRVLYKHLQQHRWARVWVEVRHRAHRLRLRGPRGVSTPLCQRLSMQISWTCKVRFILHLFSDASCSFMHLV